MLGLQEFHRSGVTHGALSFNNILIGPNSFKISDFAKNVREEYQAPEVLRDISNLSQASDVWMIGIILFKMLYGVFPFTGSNREEIQQKILGGHTKAVPNQPGWPILVSKEACFLLNRLLDKNP